VRALRRIFLLLQSMLDSPRVPHEAGA